MTEYAHPGSEITRDLARFSSTVTIADIPDVVRETYKAVLLDSLGCILAARNTEIGQKLVRSALAFGPGKCTLVGHPETGSALAAAMYNGAASHSLNFSAIGAGNSHLGAVVCGGVLAAAQECGASGAGLLTAMIVAGEVATRLAECVWLSPEAQTIREKWLLGQTLGYVGVAAGCANVLGLDLDETHSALGFAVMQAAGTTEVMRLGDVPGKAVYAGFANLGGFVSAHMAARGIAADFKAVEGKFGLLSMLGITVPPDTFADMGSVFRSATAHAKRWPLSINAERYVAALDACSDLGPHGAVQRVLIRSHLQDKQWLEPESVRRRPQSQAAAANSIQFAVASYLVRGDIPLGPAADDSLNDAHIADLAERVDYAMAPEKREIVLRYRDGSTKTLEVPDLQSTALTPEDIRPKFENCARAGLEGERITRVLETTQAVKRLTELDDCTTALRYLKHVA